jgi:uncharacterized protein (UPF0303 family)
LNAQDSWFIFHIYTIVNDYLSRESVVAYSVESVLEDEKKIASFDWNRESLTAFGNQLVEYGRKNNLPLAIAVYLEDVKIFQGFLDGSAAKNEMWVDRKINTVRAINHSTLFARAVMEKTGAYQELGLENHMGELAICGGGVAIIKNGVVFAVVIVSGLPHEDDHNLIINEFSLFAAK